MKQVNEAIHWSWSNTGPGVFVLILTEAGVVGQRPIRQEKLGAERRRRCRGGVPLRRCIEG